MKDFQRLKRDVRNCTICQDKLEFRVNPVIQIDPSATILIAGQAPGKKVHDSSIPFNDASGDKLRNWMGIEKHDFYDETKIAILPMGFCYPGKATSGDRPPRKECAPKWRQPVLEQLTNIKLSLLIGQYAINWHLRNNAHKNLTDTVKNWRIYDRNQIPLPHPSPRNFIWFSKNPWFEQELIPEIRARVAAAI